MASLVADFQRDILSSKKSVTEILRTAKIISAKLDLRDIEQWIEHELSGYPDNEITPDYRKGAGALQVFNPYRGWITVSGGLTPMACVMPIATLQEFSSQPSAHFQPPQNIPVSAYGEMSNSIASEFLQRIVVSGTVFKTMIEAVRDRLLDWSIELEKRGITGENMSFDKEEKQKAQNQTFNIQHFTGVLGDVKDSSVNVYDYSSIYQLLKQQNVSQSERNEIENILDNLKHAKPNEKASLLQKGKEWIVKNQEFLGASASVVRKALGL